MSSFIETIDKVISNTGEKLVDDTLVVFYLNFREIVTPVLIFYFICLGVALWRGAVDLTIKEYVGGALKFFVIFAIGTNVLGYNMVVYDFFTRMPVEIMNLLHEGDGSGFLGFASTSFDSSVQAIMVVLDKSGFGIKYFYAGLLTLCSLIFIGFSFFLYALSKMAMLMLLAVGPFFFLLLLFEKTAKIFEAWIQQLTNYFFISFFLSFLLIFSSKVLDMLINRVIYAEEVDLTVIVPVLLVYVIMFLFALEIKSVAASLAGSFHVVGTQSFSNAVTNVSRDIQKLFPMAKNSWGKMGGFSGFGGSRSNQVKR